MTSFLVILHVITAVLFIGPIVVSTSAFPRQMAQAHSGDNTAGGSAVMLHKISKAYGFLSALVPLLGVIVFFSDMDAYGTQGKFHASILLAIIAWVILLVVLIPRQRTALGALGLLDAGEASPEHDKVKNWSKMKSQLTMFAGIFNLLWFVVLILMFV